MKNDVFSAYSYYYDLLYRDKNYAGEVAYICNILNNHGVTRGSLLEFGSGTGKHAKLLVNQGHTVHGIELSADMVANSESISGFTCEQGDISEIKMGCQYDAVLSLFHVISYQTSNEKLHAVFANAAAHLNSKGLFIFDFWYSPAVHNQKPVVRVKRMADEKVEITRIAEPVFYPNENRVDVNYSVYVRNLVTGLIHTLHENHPMRHFSLPEIDILAGVHGFERLCAEEFLTQNTPSENTWGVCVILRKI